MTINQSEHSILTHQPITDQNSLMFAGKDKLEWSRTVDAEKLEQLKEMMASPDYKVSECHVTKVF